MEPKENTLPLLILALLLVHYLGGCILLCRKHTYSCAEASLMPYRCCPSGYYSAEKLWSAALPCTSENSHIQSIPHHLSSIHHEFKLYKGTQVNLGQLRLPF